MCRFDLFAFSGMHCLLAGMSYSDKVNLYGIGPVVTAIFLYLPVIFVRKVGPKAISEDSYLPLCAMDRFIKWFRSCWGRMSSRTSAEGEGAVKPNLASNHEGMTEEEIEEQVRLINKYNAHVRERVWFWLLFW